MPHQFERQLLEEQDPHAVAELEESGRLRVVGPDQVNPGLLHQPQLVLDQVHGRIRPEAAELIVAVDPLDLQGLAIEEEPPPVAR